MIFIAIKRQNIYQFAIKMNVIRGGPIAIDNYIYLAKHMFFVEVI